MYWHVQTMSCSVCISTQCIDVSIQCLNMPRQCLHMSEVPRHIDMPVMLSMAPLHLLGHSDQNELKHDFSGM